MTITMHSEAQRNVESRVSLRIIPAQRAKYDFSLRQEYTTRNLLKFKNNRSYKRRITAKLIYIMFGLIDLSCRFQIYDYKFLDLVCVSSL